MSGGHPVKVAWPPTGVAGGAVVPPEPGVVVVVVVVDGGTSTRVLGAATSEQVLPVEPPLA